MVRYLIKRLLLAVLTLWILATIVFVMVNLLPGNVGRQILGPFAPPSEVTKFNHAIGTDRPLISQYGHALKNLATLNFGTSYQFNKPVNDLVRPAMFRSGKLAVLALLITVPLGIVAGTIAARRRDKLADRFIVTTGLAASSTPEFVTAAIISWLFTIELRWGHVFADPPAGTSVIGQVRYLIFPAFALVIVYFGYIARMTRAGVIAAMESDYTRTAVMKGLSARKVMMKHVMRNALGPTISVVGVQVGYLFGGILGVELIFNYHGLGSVLQAAIGKHDLPVLQGAVLSIGVIYMLATLAADLLIAWLNPRVLAQVKR